MVAIVSSEPVRSADSIPAVDAAEAYALMQVELERLLALLETLDPTDWSRPTACTAWTVRDIAAHQAGGYAAGTGYREMFRQYLNIPRSGQLPEDLINARQIRERANRTPQELIAELRAVGPAAIRNWAYGFRLVKWLGIPHPVPGWLSLRYLMWIIHSRDTWMHRLDICRATGRAFEQTAAHDGRIAALVMRDTAAVLGKKLAGKSLLFELTGPAGGTWKIGAGDPAAVVRMDVLEFNIYVSGRYRFEEALARMDISGDRALAGRMLKDLLILY